MSPLSDMSRVCTEASFTREGYTRKSTEVEDFTTTDVIDEKVGNVTVFVVDFIRTYCT